MSYRIPVLYRTSLQQSIYESLLTSELLQHDQL